MATFSTPALQTTRSCCSRRMWHKCAGWSAESDDIVASLTSSDDRFDERQHLTVGCAGSLPTQSQHVTIELLMTSFSMNVGIRQNIFPFSFLLSAMTSAHLFTLQNFWKFYEWKIDTNAHILCRPGLWHQSVDRHLDFFLWLLLFLFIIRFLFARSLVFFSAFFLLYLMLLIIASSSPNDLTPLISADPDCRSRQRRLSKLNFKGIQ